TPTRIKRSKKQIKQNQMLAQLIPSEHALDELSQSESPEKEMPKDTSKGRQRASTSQNINPKGRGRSSKYILKFECQEWDHGIKLKEKKWDHGIRPEERKVDCEKEEKEKDKSFEMANLEQLEFQKHIGKKYYLITQCVVSLKTQKRLSTWQVCSSSLF
ncbi:hypothetical protein VP01_3896g2, partial [Puccinia sorghi]